MDADLEQPLDTVQPAGDSKLINRLQLENSSTATKSRRYSVLERMEAAEMVCIYTNLLVVCQLADLSQDQQNELEQVLLIHICYASCIGT